MSLFAELRRRNVFRVAIAYIVLAWLILQVGDVLVDTLELPAVWGKGLLAVLVLGFIPALIISWVYELTPQGIKKESDVARPDSRTSVTARKLDISILIMMVVVVVLLAIREFRAPSTPPINTDSSVQDLTDITTIDSIAILAFADFSQGGEQEHLAVGLSDALLHILAQIPDLRVSARTSSFSYRGTETSIATIGQELGVAAVLEGSVQRSGDTLRIIAQLIRVSDQSHLWSKTFDRPRGDIFAIQDEIAAAVASALRPTGSEQPELSPSDRTSVAAHEHYLRGNQLWRQRSESAIEAAIDEFEAAIALDPDYAPAHAGLAIAYRFSGGYGHRAHRDVQLLIEREIATALAIDPTLSLAYGVKGLQLGDMGRVDEAITALRKGLDLNPSDATMHVWLANQVNKKSEFGWDEYSRLLQRAFELDPRNMFVLGEYALDLSMLGDYEGAMTVLRQGIALEPNAARPYNNLARLHERFGHLDDAVRVRLAEIERAPDSFSPYSFISFSLLQLEDEEAAQLWLDRALQRKASLYHPSYWFLRRDKVADLVDMMQSRLLQSPDDPRRLDALCEAHLLARNYQQVWSLCADQLTEVLAPEPRPLESHELGFAVYLSWAGQALGEDAAFEHLSGEMKRLAHAANSKGVYDPGFEYFKAFLAALSNDREQVLAQLRKAVDMGFMRVRQLEFEPWWDAYQGDPEFQAIVADVRLRQTKQRNALRAEGI